MNTKTALVLSGGGARGAYQVGVLKGLSYLLEKENLESPFKILSGTSAGALNTAKLAATSNNFHSAVAELVQLWSTIQTEHVFSTDFLSLKNISLTSILKPSFFGSSESSRLKLNSFLDTEPLKKLITRECSFDNIQTNLEKGLFDSVIITANNYSRNTAVSFIQSASRVKGDLLFWNESRRHAEHASLSTEHILASSAIPLLFPPVQINGEPYGDGCIRNTTPCSPSIRMGAGKLFVIGVRSLEDNFEDRHEKIFDASLIRILNTLLNAVMLDSVEQDVKRIQRLNKLIEEVQPKKSSSLKKIPAICISPTQDIGELARRKAHHIPRLLRATVKTLGSLDDASELISYLLFEPDFCQSLIQMGFDDSIKQKDEIMSFLNEGF